jgi:sugar phosphate isomerase/epimerase
MHSIKAFLTAVFVLGLSVVRAAAAESGPSAASPIRIDHDGLKKLSWQLLCQSSSFRFGRLTVLEMIDVLHANDFHHIELSPGQPVSPEHKDVKVGPGMAPDQIDAINAKLKQVRMDIVSYNAGELGSGEAGARKVFEFGRALKVKTIVGVPSPDSLEMLDKLAMEYKINVAILNDRAQSSYSNPDAFLKAIEGRSDRIGMCADIAEWRRAGLEPARCIKTLGGHVIVVRLKDTTNPTEVADVGDALKELKAQNYKGPFCVETARGGGQDVIKNLALVVNGFSDVVTRLATGRP